MYKRQGESVSPDTPVLVLAGLHPGEVRATVTQAEVGLVEGLAGLGLAVIDFLTAQGELGRLRAVLSSLPRLSGFLDPGPDERELAAARQAVQEAEEALRKAQADLAAAALVAPFPGTVLSVEAEIGESVSPDSPVLVLADLSRMEARATVTQAEVGLVEELSLIHI